MWTTNYACLLPISLDMNFSFKVTSPYVIAAPILTDILLDQNIFTFLYDATDLFTDAASIFNAIVSVSYY